MRASCALSVVMVTFTNRIVIGDAAQQFDVAADQVRLGDNSDLQATMLGEFFQDSAGDLEALLRRLIGVGRGANGDLFAALDLDADPAAAARQLAA